MADYGVLPTGFSRKSLNEILGDVQNKVIQGSWGPDIIQTADSPMGQLNGLFAILSSLLWEKLEDAYQSYDPDQAEGNRLAMLGKIRLLNQGGLTESQFRKAITNEGVANLAIADANAALLSLAGVTYAKMFTNEIGEFVDNDLETGTVAVAVIGGDDEEIATTIRSYIAPGINTFGNHRVETSVSGYCRSFNIIRPIDVPVTLNIEVNIRKNLTGCPSPSITSIKAGLLAGWETYRINGMDINEYTIRQIIECAFPNVEVSQVLSSRDGGLEFAETLISFIEIASLSDTTTSITEV